MRIVAITRIKDEVDIVEAFIRHTAWFVDDHILIDNGSIDGTLDILRLLHAEGLPIWAFRNAVPILSERFHMNALLRLARTIGHADWVVPLETDEFLFLQDGQNSLRGVLDRVDPACPGIAIPSVIYSPRSEGNPAELIPGVQKVMIRIDDDLLGRAALGQGNHSALLDGKDIDLPLSSEVGLAHFYRRTVAQESLKAVLGRLRAITSPARFIRVLIEHAELQASLQSELLRKFDPGEGLPASEMLRLEPVF